MNLINKKMTGFFICLVLLITGISASPTFTIAYDCTRTPPDQRSGTVEKDTSYNFSWISEADKKTESSYCYERKVTNKHTKNKLDYDWPLAEMGNKSLPPGKQDRMCKNSGKYHDPALQGPLTYGRNNPPTHTEVWKSQSEVEKKLVSVTSYPPLEAALDFSFDVYGKIYRNSVILSSFVHSFDTSRGKIFRYSYILDNPGESSILSWLPQPLLKKPEIHQRLGSFLRRTEFGPQFGLEVEGILSVAFNDNRPPLLGNFRVHFFDPKEGLSMAVGSAEAYVPPSP
jgi:hypothetical protein